MSRVANKEELMSDSFDELLEKSLKNIKEVEERKANWKGACIDCKFFESAGNYGMGDKCTNPVFSHLYFDPTSGRVIQNKRRVDIVRPYESECGPVGRGFIQKPEPTLPEASKELGNAIWKRIRNSDYTGPIAATSPVWIFTIYCVWSIIT